MVSATPASTAGESYVIIGDGIAGSAAADHLSAETTNAAITVLTDESKPLYNRVLLKQFAKGDIPEETIEIHDRAWYDDRDIDLRLDTRVSGIDTGSRTIRTGDGERIDYDYLLIATGSTPRQFPVPNADAEGVTSFWTHRDAKRIRSRASEAETGTIIGAGLLGIDYAAVASSQGVEAHYLIREDHWLPRAMSPDGAEIVHEALREQGITPVCNTTVDRFETDARGHVSATITRDGRTYDSEFVGVAIGVETNTAFLDDTPIATDDGVVVDEYLRTDNARIYAAGDVARYPEDRFDRSVRNGSWNSAQAQGQRAAANMLASGRGDPFSFVPSYTVSHFQFPLASFGHPGLGEVYRERRYGPREWRRLAFRDGRLVGGMLVGDLAPMQPLKKLIASGERVLSQADRLLAPVVNTSQIQVDRAVRSESD